MALFACVPAGPFRHTPHSVRSPIWSSTECPNGGVRMRRRRSFRHTLTRFVTPSGFPPKAHVAVFVCVPAGHFGTPVHTARSPIGSSTETPRWRCSHAAPQGMSAHPSHGSCPHRELHRRPNWRCSHAPPQVMSAHPHTVRSPMRSSTEGPSGGVRMRPRRLFRHALTRIVAP